MLFRSGEKIPLAIEKIKGDIVIGATLNQSGSLTVKVTHIGQKTLLSQIMAMIEAARGRKLPIQAMALVMREA